MDSSTRGAQLHINYRYKIKEVTLAALFIIILFHSLNHKASISLLIHERNTARTDIDCPMDTISYNCSILSNSERVHLRWRVTLPGSMPVTITYDNTSILNNMDNLAMGVITTLTTYRRDEYIESLIVFTVVRNIVLNGTMIECSISDLDNDVVTLFINSSSKYNIYSYQFHWYGFLVYFPKTSSDPRSCHLHLIEILVQTECFN